MNYAEECALHIEIARLRAELEALGKPIIEYEDTPKWTGRWRKVYVGPWKITGD